MTYLSTFLSWKIIGENVVKKIRRVKFEKEGKLSFRYIEFEMRVDEDCSYIDASVQSFILFQERKQISVLGWEHPGGSGNGGSVKDMGVICVEVTVMKYNSL